MFPIMHGYGDLADRYQELGCPKEVPWEMMVPHESQAKSNHGGQSLAKLASRGGLSPVELANVLTGHELFYKRTPEVAVEIILEACSKTKFVLTLETDPINSIAAIALLKNIIRALRDAPQTGRQITGGEYSWSWKEQK